MSDENLVDILIRAEIRIAELKVQRDEARAEATLWKRVADNRTRFYDEDNSYVYKYEHLRKAIEDALVIKEVSGKGSYFVIDEMRDRLTKALKDD